MIIETAKTENLDEIQEIYKFAREFMIKSGNKTQWKSNYPQVEMLKTDIEKGKLYSCKENNDIVAVFYFAKESDDTYLKISGGSWLNIEEYAVVHRIATLNSGKGVATFCLNWCFDNHANIRIDTHEDNKPMQNLLIKLGYKKCGVIHIENGEERVAFQKC